MRQSLTELFALADVRIDGDRPWDIHVHDEKFFPRVLAEGSLALGETYMDEMWDSRALDQCICNVLKAELDIKIRKLKHVLWSAFMAKVTNPQRRSKAFEIGKRHYDRGNNLYRHMLDRRMTYSCGYWKDAATLDEAQEAKLELICRKIGLRPGMRVLDIGCGWGSFIKYAAEQYRVDAVGITVSEEQVKLGKEMCEGLPVDIRLQDYRELNEEFDCIVSVGMFEHVGEQNYRTFMRVVHRCLKTSGLFLLHTIGNNISVKDIDPWIKKYIFPNTMLPSSQQIASAAEGLFVLEDWHNFGIDYDKTLMSWYQNFTAAWEDIKAQYDRRFYRMWTYYLLSCAGSFRARVNQLWQIVLSKEGVPGGYQSIR